MNLCARQLKAFVAVVEERHFTRAAQHYHLTQPAFSALIHLPGVELALHDALLEPCLRPVREGEVDLAVAARGADMRGLLAEPLCEDSFHLVCRRDHRLARKRAVSLAALRGEHMIHLGKGSSIRQSLAANTAVQAVSPTLEVDHLATVSGLILAGLGITLVPGMTLFHFRHPELSIVPLARGSDIKRQLYLVRGENRSLSQAAASFHALLLSERGSLAQR